MPYNLINYSEISSFDVDLFSTGKHTRLYQKMGSQVRTIDNIKGIYFAVYAPAARKVEVIGNFNNWDGNQHALFVKWDGSGVWEGFIADVEVGEIYKYRIYSNHDEKIREKADPYAQLYEMPPKSASIVWSDSYDWKDEIWMENRSNYNALNRPISVYEVHLGSWKKNEDGYSLSYRQMAEDLVKYVSDMGFTHVELMPVMEHPFYLSWGYQCTGYFAPTSRYGNPEDFKYLVDKFHRAGIGVFLDWVPAHFPEDEHALADFDGSKVYEHPDKSKGFHPDWNSLIFNFERGQVRSFLLSSAHFWCDQFHVDGIRVDAVASMIYLDYSRKEGEWSPNQFGGNEYLAATELLKELNVSIYRDFPDVQMIAEESTAFSGVTRPVHEGGLGFGLKWMMGWMNDTLEYFSKESIYRSHHQNDITRSLLYSFTENFMLPLSHDEVVHGKQSLLSKMPGDDWQKFANLRLLFMYMFAHPGPKLNFMGGEIGQWDEWNVNQSVSWELVDQIPHKGIQQLIKDLNRIYKTEKCLYEIQYSQEGFEWLDISDHANSIVSFLRKSNTGYVVIILNFTPMAHHSYEIGIPHQDSFTELFNSDHVRYSGSGVKNSDVLYPQTKPVHGKSYSLCLNIPPLGGLILKPLQLK